MTLGSDPLRWPAFVNGRSCPEPVLVPCEDRKLYLSETNMTDNFAQRVHDSFSQQRFMKTLGASLNSVAPGTVEIAVPFRLELTQQNGFLHAGVITSVLDSACGYAALSKAPQGADVLSVEFKVNLLSPAVGERFIARAQVKRAGRQITVCSADAFAVRGKEEKLVATMLATMITMQPNNRSS